MLFDPTYPLTGFDDIDFDDAGIGPISLGGHLDDPEMLQRRRGSQTTTTAPTTVDDSESAFSGALETNVTASLGQTAFLRCRLKNSQHQVSFLIFISISLWLPFFFPAKFPHWFPTSQSNFVGSLSGRKFRRLFYANRKGKKKRHRSPCLARWYLVGLWTN